MRKHVRQLYRHYGSYPGRHIRVHCPDGQTPRNERAAKHRVMGGDEDVLLESTGACHHIYRGVSLLPVHD